MASQTKTEKSQTKRIFVLHPFLFILFPILTASMGNLGEFTGLEFWRLVSIGIILTIGLFLLIRIWAHDWMRAGFLTSIIIVLLFYVQYQKIFPETIVIWQFEIKSFWAIFLFWIVMILLLNSKYVWGRIRPRVLTQYLNITAAILLLLPLSQMVWYFIGLPNEILRNFTPTDPITVDVFDQSEPPNIYYIIVDGYARQDILKEVFHSDNTDFINYLEKQGFYIADQSTSNYVQTALSLASSLNMQFLDDLKYDGKTFDRKPLLDLIRQSIVFDALRRANYEIIVLDSGYKYTEISEADLILSPKPNPLSPIEGMMFQISGLNEIAQGLGFNLKLDGFDSHRNKIIFRFEQLQNIPELSSEKANFIFAHIVMPHPPFVFDQQGNPVKIRGAFTLGDGSGYRGTNEEYIQRYANQLAFTSLKLEETIDAIIKKSRTQPIIILQADHGPGVFLDWGSSKNTCIRERISILNAYLVPDSIKNDLYPSITPVNSFRILFNHLFGIETEKLPDLSYYSSWARPYQFIDVTSRSQDPCP